MTNRTEPNELYESLSPTIRAELSKAEEQAVVPAGTRLISHTAIPEHLVLIQRGSVEISVPAGQKAVFLSVAGEGKVLGLRPILAGALPEIEATTLEECTISLIPRQRFLEVLEQHPEIYLAISKILSTDLNTAERLLRDVPRITSRENVAPTKT